MGSTTSGCKRKGGAIEGHIEDELENLKGGVSQGKVEKLSEESPL